MKRLNFLWLPAAGLLGTLLPLAAQAQAPRPTHHAVYGRLHSQRARIRQGAASGELTHREAMGLERRTARIQRHAARDRYTHGGHMTAGERARMNARLNRTSGAIYRHKHDVGTR